MTEQPDGHPKVVVMPQDEDGQNVADLVEQPAKVMRIGSMIKQLLDEVKSAPLDEAARQRIDNGVRQAAYHIIDGKGATYYGVGSALTRIVRNILGDRRAIMTVCTPTAEIAGVKNVTVSLPHLVGGAGVLETFPLPLSDAEEAALHHSAQLIRDLIDQLEARL